MMRVIAMSEVAVLQLTHLRIRKREPHVRMCKCRVRATIPF